jgi:threonine synthase
MAYLSHLECSDCGERFAADRLQTFCKKCTAPLLARYHVDAIRGAVSKEEITARTRGMWRWREVLPLTEEKNMLFLGEGDTPLLPIPNSAAESTLPNVFVKDESANPTGTFKARGLAAAVSKAKELGVTKVIIPTAGNAGGALAAYAARGGLQARVLMPKDAPKANVEEARIFGAQVELVDGLISDAGLRAKELSEKEGWFDISTFKEPYRVEGKKIMGYELAEAFGWRLPDVIIYPTGGGTGLIGMWKAFAEMRELGWLETDALPRMVSVQASGCAPVVKAFEAGAERCEFWEDASTIASGLRVPKSFADKLILETLYESEGTAVAVSDEEIRAAQKELAVQEGIFAAPEGAATLAALKKLLEKDWLNPDDRVVLFNTGTGLKYL